MEMCYDGALVMPSNYAVMSEDEMMYVDGGIKVKSSTVAKVIDASISIIAGIAGIASGVGLIREVLRRNSKGAIMCLTSTALKYAGVCVASSTVSLIYTILNVVGNFTIGNGIVWAINHFDKDPSYSVIKF